MNQFLTTTTLYEWQKQYTSAIKDAAIKDHSSQKGKVKKLEDSKYVGDKEKEEVVVEGKHQQALWVNQWNCETVR